MGLEFASRREELITENERLQLVIVELLIKNEYLRTRLQHEKSI
jgi:hypothetical protein